jgi:Xaa-Pro aminopeptidase
MFQTYTASTSPEQGPPRLALLRAALKADGVQGFLVPRADAHQGEYVSDRDARLSWITGFTGSAGFCAVLPEISGVFIDGRYRVQVKAQIDTDVYTPVHWPETKLEDWLIENMAGGGTIAYDPWLHTSAEIDRLETALRPHQISLKPTTNYVDQIWDDQPDRPSAPAYAYPVEIAGKTSGQKRREISQILREAGQIAAILTLPDSIAWLLNIRGNDLPRFPVVQAFAIIHESGQISLFSDPEKFAPLGPDPDIKIHHWDAFEVALQALDGPVRLDTATAPHQLRMVLQAANVEIISADDPCILPKARKHPAEIAATRTAHIRDGAAMVNFLTWFDAEAPKGQLTEINCARKLEEMRIATGALKDISFESISGTGPNAAIVHYRVTEQTNARLEPGQLYLIDSGAQYHDGTTDITRTLPVTQPDAEQRQAFTQVLRGMIAVSRARFPVGIAGRDLDALARAPLWMAGRDYDHGTGHGVGVYLGVHEGPQRIARSSMLPLEPGMMLSNEPGYYREGAFGIRIENLIVVQEAPHLTGADARVMLCFETLTWVPIDRRMIDLDQLSTAERDWVNEYHKQVAQKIGPHVTADAAVWLAAATAAI